MSPSDSRFFSKNVGVFSPHPYLEEYLRRLGHPEFDPRDPRILFFELEEKGITNVERFMEFVWENRDANFPVNETPPAGYSLRIAHQNVGPVVWSRNSAANVLG